MENEKSTIDAEQTRLLQEMIRRQESDVRTNRVIATVEIVLLVGLIAVFAWMIPKYMKTVARVQESMEKVDGFVLEADEAMSEIMELVKDADTLIQSNEEGVNTALENFNSVDFESLNTSIASISEMITNLNGSVSNISGIISSLNTTIGSVKDILKPISELIQFVKK